MKAFLILEDGHVFEGKSIGSTDEIISEIVFNTSMTGYLEILTDPSYAGQAVVMTYPLIGNYGICYADEESGRPWPDGFIVRELSRVPSNFRSEDSIQNFLKENKFEFPEKLKWEDVPGHFYLLNRANTCMALPEVGFFYRINQGGQITAGGGKSRLDMIPIFQQLLDVQNKNDFNETERAYVVGLILNYSLWSINVTNLEYIAPLLDGLHRLFSELDKKDAEFYLNNISSKKNMESKLFEIIKNEKYLLLKDYDEREKMLGEYGEKKKGLIYGGIKCIQDHGLIYTIKWAFKKYLSK